MNFYVLAGGLSTRMGQNKALMKLNGIPVLEKVISAIPAKDRQIKIITNSPDSYDFLPQQKIKDIYPNLGPISGVHAGLVDSPFNFNFFLACDLPLLSGDLIEFVLNKHSGQDIFGIKTEKGLEPLCTVYSKNCLPVMEEQIARKRYSLHELFELASSKFIGVENSESLFNVNTLQDWQKLSGFKNEYKKEIA